jgi:type I restriction enzyme M protein
MPANHTDLEKRLWDAADELRANSKLKSSEYSIPVLGLIFLRYADHKFAEAEKRMPPQASGRRKIGKTDYQAQGVLYLPEKARFGSLLNLPEGTDIGKAINEAMKAIETENEDLKDVLPKTYNSLEKNLLVSLLKNFSSIPMTIEGDAFGKIYEYFLGKFAMSEGQKGGEFFTPTSIVKLIVEIIEPFHGQEKVAETIRLCKMNLAVHGLSGDIRQAVTYYEDVHKSVGKFDFVMANPPFNVDKVDKERIKDDPRYPFGLPKADNANYLWIQVFYSTLNSKGRAGFVMANSAGDARGSELEIRQKLLKANAVDVMVSVGPNFFYTVTLPCTLWFLDRGKSKSNRKDKVLFIDARHIFRQIDRAHREFTPEQIEFIANIVRLYRGEDTESEAGSSELMKQSFPRDKYVDVAGLCRVATLAEIEAQGWSLSPGHYVRVAERPTDDFEFAVRLEQLNEGLQVLNAEARELEDKITDNVNTLLAER